MKFIFDEAEVRTRLRAILLPGQVTELRCLNCKLLGEYRTDTYSGYFNNSDALIAALRRIESASACYFMPNPIDPNLLGRAYNRARIIRKEPLTTDQNIAARRWLLIDVDPVRPAGLSSTDAEKEAAFRLLTDIDNDLWERGFPPGIIGDSGNGAHLMIPVDLPANDDGFHERFLKGLAAKWDRPEVKVDTSVHNPARIWKLPGTLVCKGDHCPEIGRVWRLSRIVRVCEEAARV